MSETTHIRALQLADEAIGALTVGDAEKLSSLLAVAGDIQIPDAASDIANLSMRCNVLEALLRSTARNLRLLRPGMKEHLRYI